MARLLALVAVAFAALSTSAAASPLAFPRRVLFVGTEGSPRTAAFVALLEQHFADVRVASRKGFDPASAQNVDVVLLDWSQGEANFPKDPSPLGERRLWKKPTVFLGSAGLLVAVQWQIIGGSG
jgi:hypothetical protein